MTKPNSRSTLKDYCLRKLGYPVLEINVDDDQIDDLLDDGIQYFQERHFDGIERVYLKHKLREADITKAKSTETTSSASTGISNGIHSDGNVNSFIETNNYLKLPDHVIGVEKVFKMDASTISSGLFNIKYQLFLNDLYYYGALDLMNYAMTKTYLEDLSRLITPDTQIRFNKKQHNLYLDVDWAEMTETWIIMDCYRLVDPGTATDIYNDWWLKRYVTALIKKQWGQNLIKFQGVMLPGGIQLNGRQIYDDAVKELEQIEYELKTEYELPPMDLIG
tara:strand:+ start:6781 stop:7611 length:831 start_codon:yes stop_codon:yes gene_type:complete